MHAAAWVTVKVLPAIVSVPVRLVVRVLAATVNPVDPEPVPEAPLFTVIQLAPLVAVQPQPAVVVTVDEPVPPVATTDWLFGEIAKEQAAACVTVNVAPAIVSVPVRPVVRVFAAMLNAAVPEAAPVAPPVTVIHAALLMVAQVHPAVAVTALLPVPPAAEIDWLPGEMDGVQPMAVKENAFERVEKAIKRIEEAIDKFKKLN